MDKTGILTADSVKKIRNKLKISTDNNIIKKRVRAACYVKEIQCRKLQRLSG